MLLQKVNHESGKPSSGNLLKVVFYVLSLAVAYFAGYEHSKTHPSVTENAPEAVSAAPSPATPAEDAAAVPLPTPGAMPSATPALIGEMTPVRVEKATAVAPSSTSAPSAAPVKQANDATITEPLEIPVKDGDGKITGYINLQRGQLVTVIAVDHDQIKIKSGNSSVMVPIKSTDMAH
jgi:hypothetical protein